MIPKVTMSKALGKYPSIYRFIEKTGLSDIINEIVPNRTQTEAPITTGELMTLLTVNRLIEPSPLYKISDCIKKMGIDLILPYSADDLNDDRIARELDHIYPYWEQIKSNYIKHVVDTYNIDPRLIHFDTSSIYFEGLYKESDFITFGYSRDQKPDKKQINLGINATDVDTFPIHWKILPGNMHDSESVIDNMNELRTLFPSTNFIYVGDRAMMNEAIYKDCINKKYDFIVAMKSTNTTKALISTIQPKNLDVVAYHNDNPNKEYKLGEFTILIKEGSELPDLRAIVVWSKQKSEKDKRQRDRGVHERITKLENLKKKLNKPYYRTYKSINKKIGKIINKNKISKAFKVELTGSDGDLHLTYTIEQNVLDDLAKKDGFYILVTSLNKEDYQAETIFNIYKRQYLVESDFKVLKKTIKIRPIFVHQFERIAGLVYLTMFALCIYCLLEIILKRNSIKMTCRRLFEHITGYILIQMLLPDSDLLFQLGPLSEQEFQLLEILGISDTDEWILNKVNAKFRLGNTNHTNDEKG